MRIARSTLGLALGAALSLAACSSSAPLNAPVSTEVAEPAATAGPPAAADTSAAAIGETQLGSLLVGPDGRTLYGFTNDTAAVSTCYDACATAWPPVIVDKDWGVAPGVDIGIFATTTRDDGQLQLIAGKWPLYYYAADTKPGDLTGQGSGDVWFAVDPQGKLVEGDVPIAQDSILSAPVQTADTPLGPTLVDDEGFTLYGFTNDGEGDPTCVDACATTWPPLTVESMELPTGLDDEVFSVVDRSDGSSQLKAGKWPLYRFASDAQPGDVNGQGSGGVWFAAKPDGSLNMGS